MDIMSDKSDSLGRKGKGPFNRNLAMPNELENRLKCLKAYENDLNNILKFERVS